MQPADSHIGLDPDQLSVLNAVVDRIYPDTEWGPGGARLDVAADISRQLGGAYGTGSDSYASGPFAPNAHSCFGWQRDESRLAFFGRGLLALDRCAAALYRVHFVELTTTQQDRVLGDIEIGSAADGFTPAEWIAWFDLVLEQVFTALFIAPVGGRYGTAWAWDRLLNGGEQ
ncbi:gluconate 2-dehydrogenase subunit 3 family protein [Nocardia jiangxiensis]|uniref:Gluconate 2-dehydrogenase subunit 3 family protein n=1 Tax=Nocardia jiangxiensis TaxID=282685 RepID=A0ABW6S6R0_9NOCA